MEAARRENNQKPVIIFLLALSAVLIAGVVLFACLYFFRGNKEETLKADKIIYGTIYTEDENGSIVSSIAIKDDLIIYSGDKNGIEKYIDENTEIIKTEDGQMVIAGFNDGHNHASTAWNRQLYSAQIPSGATAEECIAIIQEFVNEHPNLEYYKAYGWEDSAFGEEGPTAAILDQVTTDKPIVATASDGHSEWVNTAMLKLITANGEPADVAGGTIERYADGTLKGTFRDNATKYTAGALPKDTADNYYDAILKAQEEYAELGYTSYVEAMVNDKADLTNTPILDAYEKLDQEGKLKIYVQGSYITTNNDAYLELVDKAIAARDKTKGGMFELTEVKVFMDGVVEGQTAYMSEPYLNNLENYGSSSWTTEEDIEKLSEVVAKANQAGMAVHFHTIGDQALTNAVAAVEKAYAKAGQAVLDARNIVVHLQVVDEAVIEKMSALNMVADINPWCSKAAGYFYEIEVPLLGEERANSEYPNKSFIEGGVHVAAGTDYGASFTYNPIEAYHIYVTRMDKDDDPETLLNADQKLTPSQALFAMTYGSAWQMHREDSIGSLETGKKANLVILSQNLYKIADSEIMNTKVVKTMASGEWIYSK